MTTEEFKRDILRLQPRLQRTAESIIGDSDSAADVVQEAVITLWEQRSSIKGGEMEKLSLTVVKRRSIDLLRMSSTHVYATLSRAYKSLREAIKQYKEEQ